MRRIGGVPLLDGAQVTLISLALGVLAALALAMIWLRPPVLAPLQEGRRLIDSVGWAAILPQLLAALGAIFTLAGVGHAVGDLATQYIPLGQPFEAVVRLLPRHGAIHHRHGQCVRGISGDDGRHRPAAHRAQIRRQPRDHGRDRHAGRASAAR